jgi:ABC-type branched-subunit amino acid transport system permease subunit
VTATIARFRQSFFSRDSAGDVLTVRLPIFLLLALPAFAPTLFPTTRLVNLAVTAAIYVIIANGLHVIFSYNGQLSLAHTTLWGLGAYTAGLLLVHYSIPFALLLPAAGLTAAFGAVLIGLPAFRTGGFSFAIVTFAAAEILRLIGNDWTSLTHGGRGITINLFSAPTSIGPIKFDTFNHLGNFYYLTLIFAYLSIAGIWAIRYSSLGKTFIAIRENETLARSVGINVYFYKLLAFAISGFFAGVAGVLFLYHQKHIDPGPLSPFGALYSIQFLLMILIGGRTSVLGPVIGAIVVVFGPELINSIFGNVLTPTRAQIVFGSTLALSVLTAPNGIAGQTRDGYNTFVAVLRHSRGRGRSWPASGLLALAYAFWPRAAQRRGINIRPERRS